MMGTIGKGRNMTDFNENVNIVGQLTVTQPWSDWLFLRQKRDVEGNGGFHIHNPWGNSNQPQGDPSRNRLEFGYKTPSGQHLWGQLVIHGPTGNVGIGTVQPNEKLHVNGNIRVNGDILLGNADCAEEFTVKNVDLVEPGMVMVLNEDETVGPCIKAYDRKVTGVISGAGAYHPAIILNKQENSTDRVPIAIMGKVLCKVDSSYAKIEIGDLLTTSRTLGHAMRAVSPVRAFGSVIGKALASAHEGRSMIPVLVSLR